MSSQLLRAFDVVHDGLYSTGLIGQLASSTGVSINLVLQLSLIPLRRTNNFQTGQLLSFYIAS